MDARQEEDLVGESKNAGIELDAASGAVGKECSTFNEQMEGCVQVLQASLKQKVVELEECRSSCAALHSAFDKSQEDAVMLKAKYEQEVQDLKRRLCSSESQLKKNLSELESRVKEGDVLAKELDKKDDEMVSAKEELRQYRERNSALEFSVQTLRGRLAEQFEEMQRNEERTKSLNHALASAESEIAFKCQLIKELQLKVEIGDEIAAKSEEAGSRIRELEKVVAESVAALHEKDERLEAAECALGELQMERSGVLQQAASQVEMKKSNSEDCRSLCMALECDLLSSREEITSLKAEIEREKEASRQMVSAKEAQLKEKTLELQSLATEMKLLVKDVASKEEELLSAKEEARKYQERNSALEFSMQTLHVRLADNLAESQLNEERTESLSSAMQSAESQLACDRALIKDLQLKLENANEVAAKLVEAGIRIKQLESTVAELSAVAQETDQKLAASDQALRELLAQTSNAQEHARAELEKKMAAWNRTEEQLAIELQVLGRSLEDNKAALEAAQEVARGYKARCEGMGESIQLLQISLKEKVRELEDSNVLCARLESALRKCQGDMALLKTEAEHETNCSKERLSATEIQLKQLSSELESRTTEADLLAKELHSRDDELSSARAEARQYSERTTALEFSLETLQRRVADHLAEIEAKEDRIRSLTDTLQVKESRLADNDQLIQELQLKVENANEVASKLAEAGDMIKKLETMVAEAQAVAQQKDDKLGAAEAALKLQTERATALEEVSKEMETKKAHWSEQEAQLASEVQELGKALEESKAVLEAAQEEALAFKRRCSGMEECIDTLRSSLEEKIRELVHFKDACTALESLVEKSREDMTLLKAQNDEETGDLRRRLSAAEAHLQQTVLDRDSRLKELDMLTRDLASREDELISAKQELREYRERNSALEFSVQTLQDRVADQLSEFRRSEEAIKLLSSALENVNCELASRKELIKEQQLKIEVGAEVAARLSEARERIKELEDALAESGATAQLKDEKLTAAEEALRELRSQSNNTLQQATAEMQGRKAQWKEREDQLHAELRKLEDLLAEKEAALGTAERAVCSSKEACSSLLEKVAALERSLQEGSEELERYRDSCVQLETALVKSRDDMAVLNAEAEQKTKQLKGSLSAVQLQLKENQLLAECREQELKLVSSALTMKEADLLSANQELAALREKNGSLDFSVETLQRRMAERVAEVLQNEEKMKEMSSVLVDAESRLSANEQLIKELEVKLEVGQEVSAKLAEAMERINELEAAVADSVAAAQDKDQKLTASEWTIEQLGKEIFKTKANLSNTEKENTKLQYKYEDLERHFDQVCERLEGLEAGKESLAAELETTRHNLALITEELEKEKSASTSTSLAVEAMLADWQAKVRLALEEKEAFSLEHKRALRTIDELRCQLKKKSEKQEKLKQLVRATESQLEAKESRLKLVLVELEKAQKNSKDLVQEMQFLHDNLARSENNVETSKKEVQAEKAGTNQDESAHYLHLCDSLIRKNASLERQVEILQRKSRVMGKQIDGFQSSNKSKMVDAKENFPSDLTQDQQHLFKSSGKPGQVVETIERSPLQVLQPQLPKRRRQGDVAIE